jgi:hypothetical protein
MEAVMKASRGAVIAIVAAGLLLGSACSKATTTTATNAKPSPARTGDFTGDPEGPYCRAALQWAVVEMTPRDGTPPVEKKYWNDYVAFLRHGEDVAPSEIKSDLKVYTDRIVNVVPVIQKYGYDEKQFDSKATADEKKIQEPPADVQKSFENVLAYEWQVCGNGTPDQAKNVKFTGDKDSAYCKSEQQAHEAFGKIEQAGWTPEATRAFFTGKTFTEAVLKSESVAPEAIKSDVAANVNWIRTKQLPVLAKYGYDIKRIKLQGTAEERFATDMSAVEIRDVERRLNAYDSQVCGL